MTPRPPLSLALASLAASESRRAEMRIWSARNSLALAWMASSKAERSEA
jgi:hypothetical protein